MKKQLTTLMMGSILCACTPAEPMQTNTDATPTVSPAQLKRVWMLTALAGFSKNELTAAKAEMNWTALPQAAAYMGCNRMMFNADVSGDGKVAVGAVASTRMYCADNMKLENTFGRLLPEMKYYRLHGHELTLHNGQGTEMRFIAQDWD